MTDRVDALRLGWLREQSDAGHLTEIVQHLEAVLGLSIEDEECDLEEEIARFVGRPLTSEEMFQLRPVLMELYDNLYGEE